MHDSATSQLHPSFSPPLRAPSIRFGLGKMDDIDSAFDVAYRTYRIEAGDDPSTLPNPYSRPSLTDPSTSTSSGAGGFIPDDPAEGGGGFIPDDDAPAGGFLPEDEDAPSGSTREVIKPTNLPLSAIPEALSNLGLDATDPSVLSLFAETAYTPSSSRRRLPPGVKQEKVVGRVEFQQVASILLEQAKGEEEEDGGEGSRRPKRRAAVQGRRKAARIVDEEEMGGGGFVVDDADDSEDDFARRRGGPALDTGSDLTSEDEEEPDPSTRRRRRPTKASPSPSPSPSDDLSDSRTPKRRRTKAPTTPSIRSTSHLNPLQRENATSLFSLLLDRLPPSQFPPTQRRIGVDELTKIVAAVGEKMTPKEIEEMIEEGAKLFAPATIAEGEGEEGKRKSAQAIRGAAAAQGIRGEGSLGLDEFAGVLVHNRLI